MVNAVASSGTPKRLTAKESHVCQIGLMALWAGVSFILIAIGDEEEEEEEEKEENDLLGDELLLLLLLLLLYLFFGEYDFLW
jgi:hypothetical protein